MLTVSRDGAELARLADSLLTGRRRIIGVTGTPGSGKSVLAEALVRRLGTRAAYLPMDGFHLADVELARQGILDRKGAPETFDAWGYAALLGRVRSRPSYPVYAPSFERDLEQPLAGAIAIVPDTEVVITEGNYLMLDRPEWRTVRSQVDEVWYVVTDDRLRRERLLARHVAFGKDPAGAWAWIERVDEPNARLIEATRNRADRRIDLTAWRSPG
ncbi:MAG TPA: nucleoside/nucleotide kinase family protein [Nocardioidaceae bacterium]|nr:nucleoside/nucleotide kinase family protein [Nocardioidaceae bacterium]